MKVNSKDNFEELFDKAVNIQLTDKHHLQVVEKSQEDLARDVLSKKPVCNAAEDSSIELFTMTGEDMAYAHGLDKREEKLKEKITQQSKE